MGPHRGQLRELKNSVLPCLYLMLPKAQAGAPPQLIDKALSIGEVVIVCCHNAGALLDSGRGGKTESEIQVLRLPPQALLAFENVLMMPQHCRRAFKTLRLLLKTVTQPDQVQWLREKASHFEKRTTSGATGRGSAAPTASETGGATRAPQDAVVSRAASHQGSSAVPRPTATTSSSRSRGVLNRDNGVRPPVRGQPPVGSR